MTTPKTSSYIKFLNLIDAIDRINPGKKLDCIEESLLDKIVACAHAKQAILVGDLISIGRKKEVLPTKMALKRYEEISKCLEKAVKAV